MPKASNVEIRGFYYITHIENLRSILSKGIFSHQHIEDTGTDYKPIYDETIVGNRKLKSTPDGRSLWQFANVYFQPRNPMLYRVKNEQGVDNLAIIELKPSIMTIPDIYITNGNAANTGTGFYRVTEGTRIVSLMWNIIRSEWWNSEDGSKRKIMAECLVPKQIPPDYISSIFVASHEIAKKVQETVPLNQVLVIPEPKMFFRPDNIYRVANNITLAEGDMFFSDMQTLTVSVNTVGIMGKGLASRAKYQFPDVYVHYQDACRNKTLRMGKPFLYKREKSFDDELADEPGVVLASNDIKWFLLFATKRSWKEDSDLSGIEEGLRWLVANHKKEGIKSIALPALGCGLGNLDWKDVGPIMCQLLANMTINAAIYLPREKPILKEFLSPEYLLTKRQ